MEKFDFKNLSTTYLVPLISKLVNINRPLLKGSFLYYEEALSLSENKGLFLLFKWDNEYEEYLLNNKFVENHYDINGEHIMIYCKYSSSDLNDVKLIIEGKYSQISIENKKKILNYYNASPTSKVYKVLYKDKSLKQQIENDLNITLADDMELGQIINKQKETFKYKKEVYGEE
jgi:hypothetical protein